MPLFQYKAYDKAGKSRRGAIEARDPNSAKEKLRDQGLMVATLALKEAHFWEQRGLAPDTLTIFTLQLAQLLKAGLPLYEGLLTLEEQYRDEHAHAVILSLAERVRAGASLSEAMGGYPESFDTLYCSMVAAGEAAGALDKVLERLSQFLVRQQKLRKQLITAMIYPAILSGFCLVVIALLLGFVVPSLQGIFADRELNTFTQLVMGVSTFFNSYGWVLVPLVVLGAGVGYLQLQKPSGRLLIERWNLKLPLVKTLTVQAALARFSRTMATLQEGGLTVVDALALAKGVMQNHILEEIIDKAAARIHEGSNLSEELRQHPLMPKFVSRMLAVGEETGNTTAMWGQIADLYEGEVEKTVGRLMALAQPVILIVMGVIIGSVLLAILLPLTDISGFGE